MRAGIYARKSTEQTGVSEDANSVTRHVEHASAYAKKKGWTVADEHTYSDDGISGAEGALTHAEGHAPLFTLPLHPGLSECGMNGEVTRPIFLC